MMRAGETSKLIRRFRIAIGVLIAGLVLSGITAFPLLSEVRTLTQIVGLGQARSAVGHDGLAHWLLTVRFGLETVYADYPWIAYGTDWLGFAHLVVAAFFVGPLIAPWHSRHTISAGIAACIGVIPLALICGEIREVPLFSRLIDCSFGVGGLLLLLYCRRLLPAIEAGLQPANNSIEFGHRDSGMDKG